VPRAQLLGYLRGAGLDGDGDGDGGAGAGGAARARARPNETPGMDCSIVATRHGGLFSVTTTDFFYPNVEEPYAQGRVAACNVLSDLYAAGVVEPDSVLMALAVSLDMLPAERDAVTARMMRGFVDACTEAGCAVTGGQTIQNPWPIIGGVASATCAERELVRPEGALVGDVLVLTKPLGTQVAANLWQWRDGGARFPKFDKVRHLLVGAAEAEAEAGAAIDPAAVYDQAVAQMGRLNREGAAAMHAHGAHAATDVTGFGLLGHADNLALHTRARVRLELSLLPCIRGTVRVDDALGGNFRLRQGLSAETSGGLLVALPPERAQDFIAALSHPAWVVGRVLAAAEGEPNRAELAADAQAVEV
jgi:selenide,water dikinase